jgi:hypothetical protein
MPDEALSDLLIGPLGKTSIAESGRADTTPFPDQSDENVARSRRLIKQLRFTPCQRLNDSGTRRHLRHRSKLLAPDVRSIHEEQSWS